MCTPIRIFGILLLVLAAVPGLQQSVQAQYKFNRPLQITKESGLPVIRNVRFLREGDDGFMWIGSHDGLCRFDGQQFKVWRHNAADNHSLLDDEVSVVLPVNTRIWAGTSQGISVLDTRHDTFTNYQINGQGKLKERTRGFDLEIGVLFKDPAGEIWVGTRSYGLWKYMPDHDDFYQYNFPPEAYPAITPTLGSHSTILSIEAHDSLIWAGTTAGLQQINKKTGRVEWFTFPRENKVYQVNLNAFRRLCYHSNGLLYVGTWEAGVNVFDPVMKTLHPLPLHNEEGRDILASPITRIISRTPEELWISTAKGFVVYHTGRQEVVFFKKNDLPRGEFFGAETIDRKGRIWYTAMNKILCFDPLMQQFASFSYDHLRDQNDWGYTFFIIPDTNRQVLTVCPSISESIYLFDQTKQTWTRFSFKRRLTIRGFTRRPTGDFVISADEGLFNWSPGRKLQPIPPIPGVRFRRWGDVLSARDGKMWLCAYDEGLVCFEPGKSKPRIFTCRASNGESPGGLHQFGNLMEDSKGNIWFVTIHGFGVYDAAKDSVYHFSSTVLEKNTFPFVLASAEDKQGRVWMSGRNGWLGYAETAHPENGIVYKMNLAVYGIAGNIHAMEADANGDAWGYTENELLKFNTTDRTFTSFSFKYGVKAGEFFHFSILPSGELLFGGRNEIILADPSGLQRNRELPRPYLTEILVLNKPHPYQSMFGGSLLQLRHWENFFSVGFSAQAFTLGNEVRFRYRLSGFDDWAEAGTRRFANYTNVPGGKYVFQLQAANNEGDWNGMLLEIPVVIATAWWASGWFRSVGSLCIAVLVYGVYRYRIGQIRRKARLKADYEKKLAHVEMSALLAQMNPHFLFNSLNSIDSYIIKNESKRASEYLNNFARLIRLILQHSRSGSISLADELEALDLYLQMESLRFDHCFQYEIRVEASLRASSIVIPPMLIQPYLENAIWHGLRHHQNGHCEGFILLKIARDGDYLHCIVEDNGIGRERSAALKVGKNGKNHKKSMGMHITSDRLELINKLRNVDARVEIFDLKDETGQACGTRVELTIPM